MNALLLCLTVGLAPASGGLDGVDIDAVKQQKQKQGPTRLEFDIEPNTVDIHVGNPRSGKTKRIGKARKGRMHKVRPGDHLIKLVHGRDETEFVVRVAKGQTYLVQFKFEDSGIDNTPPPAQEEEEGEEEAPPAKEEKPKKKPEKEKPRYHGDGEPDDPFGDIPE